MNNLKFWFINLKFRNKILLISIAAGCIPIIVLGSMWYYQLNDSLVTREEENLSNTLNQAILNIDYKIENHLNILEQIIWNDEIKNGLTADYSNNFEMYQFYKNALDPWMSTPAVLNREIESVTIYTGNEMNPYDDLLRPLHEVSNEKWFESAAASNEPILEFSSDDEKIKLISRIFDERRTVDNFIQMELNSTQFFESLTQLFDEAYGLVIINDDGQQVFNYNYLIDSDELSGSFVTDENEPVNPEALRDNFIVQSVELRTYPLTVYLYRPDDVISVATFPMKLTVVIVILLSSVIMFLSIYLLVKVVVKPLEKLSKNMETIENGNLSVSVFSSSNDEIGSLIKQFGNMVNKLKQMINQVYKSKIEQQEYEMKALQAQINPHFFYNSLSLINSKAIMAEQEDISQMAQHLSIFYRTTLNQGKSIIKVEKELENVKAYVSIQKMMHSDSFDVQYELDTSVYDYTMLNLLLQPLVENAINHGIDHKEDGQKGRIIIKLKQIKDELVFTVIDNGPGISQEKMKFLLTKKSEGYGVRNVHERIQMWYGPLYGLKYESKIQQYTKVTLTIPVNEKNSDDSQ
ncbi:cache domain-containing sensor histidine kinase [Corticicoccus populi]|uniref:histidine kinase n=1 Tax=Corticicoccus populi TaxID=1812821 RepID=A0ABW5X1M3_9STAP